jgi:hypothetical protein
MDYKVLVFSRIISLLIGIYIINRVRKNLLNEKESLFWVIGAFSIMIIAFFPGIIESLSFILGIHYPPAFLFLVAILILFSIVYRQFCKISILNDKVNELIRTVSILSFEVNRLENSEEKVENPNGKVE